MMVHPDGSARLNWWSIILHRQSLAAATNHISIRSTSCTTDVNACGRSYSLCAVWICHRKEGYSYVFSRWISREILPFRSNRLYSCRRYCTHQLHIGGQLHTPPWCSSAMMGTPQSLSALLSLYWRFDIAFTAPYSLFSWSTSTGVGTPKSTAGDWLGKPQLCSRLFTPPSVSNNSGLSLRVRVLVRTKPLTHWRSRLSKIPNRQFGHGSMEISQPVRIGWVVSGLPSGSICGLI